MTKTIGKYLLAVGVVAALGLGALFLIQYLRDAEDPEKQAQKYMEALEKAYREDQYGGNTPEETLQLFIDALKKGDTDLAAKYFDLEHQKKWQVYLASIKERKLLNDLIKNLERTKLTKETEEEAYFTLVDENNVAVSEIVFGRNTYNKRWKIFEM